MIFDHWFLIIQKSFRVSFCWFQVQWLADSCGFSEDLNFSHVLCNCFLWLCLSSALAPCSFRCKIQIACSVNLLNWLWNSYFSYVVLVALVLDYAFLLNSGFPSLTLHLPRTSGGVSHMFFHESFYTLTTYAFPTRGRRWLYLLIQIRYPQHIAELPAHFSLKYQTWVTLLRLLALDFLLLGVNACCYSELKNFESF